MRSVLVAILGTALAGCAPKPLPDWVVTRPVEATDFRRAKVVRAMNRRAPDRAPRDNMALPPPNTELLPFTPEWQAREDEFDRRLRRSMHICGNC